MPPEPTGRDGLQYLSQAGIDIPVHLIIEQDGAYDGAAVSDLDDAEFLDPYRWMLTDRIFSCPVR